VFLSKLRGITTNMDMLASTNLRSQGVRSTVKSGSYDSGGASDSSTLMGGSRSAFTSRAFSAGPRRHVLGHPRSLLAVSIGATTRGRAGTGTGTVRDVG